MQKIIIEVKNTVWDRFTFYVPEEQISNIQDELSSRSLEDFKSYSEIKTYLESLGLYEAAQIDTLFDTMEYMTTEKNEGQATVEIYDTNMEMLNSNKVTNKLIGKEKEWQEFFDWLESIDTNCTVFTDELRQSIIDGIYSNM